ncbi:MAG: flagellar biosynthesis protein FliQ [Proteobacteria bacterium]|jgi:flagellar biosynthesis protein FliQ|nr:flagellar biosynthesis protein FliQ [Pseudomonadota bacterium]
MGQDVIVQIFRDVLKTTLIVMAPALLASIVVGLLISIFQAATQIHEMTLVFVPKILVIAACLMVLFPWMINVLTTYTITLFSNIPVYVK